MQRCHAVGGVGEVDVHVGHVHPVVLVDDGKALVLGAGASQFVQFFDDRHQLRHHSVQIGAGPRFQRFGQNGVVGVGAGLGDDLHSLFKLDAALAQQTDQLRNDHGRMGIVDLDHNVIIQLVQIVALLLAFHQDELCAVADHEILLVDTKQLSGTVAVIRVEEQCQIFLDLMLVKVDAV